MSNSQYNPRSTILNKKTFNAIALAVLVCALLFYSLSVLAINRYKTHLLNLAPYPDAAEYYASAMSMYRYSEYAIQIGEHRLPPRYPMGYSLVMLPLIYILSDESILAPFWVNQLLGLGLIFGFFFYYFLNRRPVAATVAVALLVTMPAFVVFARSSMSELLGAALLILAYYCFSKGMSKGLVSYFYVGGFILGISTLTRLQLVFFAPLLLSAFTLKNQSLSKRLVVIALSGLFLCIAASPMLLYNWKVFGSPLKTGYHFWIPETGPFSKAFGARYFLSQIASLWQEFTLASPRYLLANTFGAGQYYSPAFFILAMGAALWFLFTNRQKFLVLPAGLFAGLMLFYYFIDVRMYFPIALLAIFPIATLAETYFDNTSKQHAIVTFLLLVLLVVAIIGFPYRNSFTGELKVSHSRELLNPYRYIGVKSVYYELVAFFKKRYGQSDALIVSSLNPVYVNSLLDSNVICIPQDDQHDYKFSKAFRFNRDDAIKAIKRAAERNKRVFYLSAKDVNVEELQAILPPLEGFQWKELYARRIYYPNATLIYSIRCPWKALEFGSIGVIYEMVPIDPIR
jgi:hypothetical protein